jgi:hypothetical protein
VAVPDVEDLEGLPPGPEVKAAVGEHPVYVQEQQADGLGPPPDIFRIVLKIHAAFLVLPRQERN